MTCAGQDEGSGRVCDLCAPHTLSRVPGPLPTLRQRECQILMVPWLLVRSSLPVPGPQYFGFQETNLSDVGGAFGIRVAQVLPDFWKRLRKDKSAGHPHP